jgi:quercetin dioxygenase-like cupin family protein
MKFLHLQDAPSKPISHDPDLIKKVLAGPGALPHIEAVSHIELNPGDTAVSHRHEDAYEVFFGLGGCVEFVVEQETVSLVEGGFLVIEPGETHSIRDAALGSRMLYFLLKRD